MALALGAFSGRDPRRRLGGRWRQPSGHRPGGCRRRGYFRSPPAAWGSRVAWAWAPGIRRRRRSDTPWCGCADCRTAPFAPAAVCHRRCRAGSVQRWDRLDPKEAGIILKMIKSGFNSPLTSGMGRLFDAVASLIGLRDSITFEAEAAIELEHIADEDVKEAYSFEITGGAPLRIDFRPMVREIIEVINNGS